MTRVAGIASDITESRQAQERLAHLAHYDQLTNLPNRGVFYQRLTHALEQAERHHWTIGVMFIDLDRFKTAERVRITDVALLGVATYKLSRLVAKEKVTSFLRAPFTEFQESSGHGEVEEKPQGHGLRLAVGELLVCPYCLGLWVAGGFAAGMVVAPRSTRLVASVFATKAVSDFLQLAYKAAEERSEPA